MKSQDTLGTLPAVDTRVHEMEGLTLRKAKAILLIERGVPVASICNETGLDHRTVDALADGRQSVPLSALTRLRQSESEKLTLIGHRIMDSVLTASDEEIAKMPIGQRMVALGISVDKRNLLEGLPTQRLEIMTSDDAIDQEIVRLERLINDKLKVITSSEVPVELEVVEEEAPPPPPKAKARQRLSLASPEKS